MDDQTKYNTLVIYSEGVNSVTMSIFRDALYRVPPRHSVQCIMKNGLVTSGTRHNDDFHTP